MLEPSSPRYWSTEPTQPKSTMDQSNSQHNSKMSHTASHDWLLPLQRSASKRGKHNVMADPLSPSSDHRRTNPVPARARFMTAPDYSQECSPVRRNKPFVPKPSLGRRVTAPSRMSSFHSSEEDMDIPLEITIRLCHSEVREEPYDVSDISVNDEDEVFGWGKAFPVGDKSLLSDATHLFESSGSSAAHWGIAVPRLDDPEIQIWPSDEGSPDKTKQENVRTEDDLPPMMLRLCSLDDERQDYSITPLADGDLMPQMLFVDDKRQQQYAI